MTLISNSNAVCVSQIVRCSKYQIEKGKVQKNFFFFPKCFNNKRVLTQKRIAGDRKLGKGESCNNQPYMKTAT